MRHENDGFYDVTGFDGDWAREVSGFATALSDNGVLVFRDKSRSNYSVFKRETFFERKNGKRSLLDDNAWVRISKIRSNSGTDIVYLLDYRKSIGGAVVKKSCTSAPTIFQIENETREYDGLVSTIENECMEYHFLFEKPSEENPEVGAVVDLVVTVNDFEFGENSKPSVCYLLKDKTESIYGSEVSEALAKDVAVIYRIFRRTMKKKGKETLITNPYQDAMWICAGAGSESSSEE